jgi:arylsulfatase
VEGASFMSRRPNIVLILVDDMGWSDLGCYGGEIRTPNLDAVADAGTRWTQFYNCARCCPTRASLLTGLYPHQAGIGFMDHGNKWNRQIYDGLDRPQYRGSLDKACPTVAELLRTAGYQTFMSGKWHVGQREPSEYPRARGFDRYYGILAGACNYWRPQDWARLLRDDEPLTDVPPDFYTTDAFSREAARFVDEADPQRPFFLYLAYNAPHWPLHAWPEDIHRYRGRYDAGWDALRDERFARQKQLGLFDPDDRLSPRDPDSHPWSDEPDRPRMAHRMAVYAAMVDRMDQGVGRVLDALRRKDALDDTLIVFLSDNGACAEPYGADSPIPAGPPESDTGVLLPWANASNTPLRLFKHWTHEGGMRTPFIASWPRRIAPGAIDRENFAHVKDLLPTFLDAAGAEYDPARFAGTSILPWLTGDGDRPHETLFMEHEGNRCVRDGRFKLVSFYNERRTWGAGTGPRTGPWELYDIVADPTELHDLAPEHPHRVRDMAERYRDWAERTGVVDWETAVRAGGLYDFREDR